MGTASRIGTGVSVQPEHHVLHGDWHPQPAAALPAEHHGPSPNRFAEVLRRGAVTRR
jgi:hypothetical protein